jgi:sporulation-control protein
MKRVLCSIGIGAATVDTVLPRAKVTPGDTVTADVNLYGGDATQEIQGIRFVLKARLSGGADEERVVGEFGVEETITLEPDDERTIPVDVHVPLWTPITEGGASVWLETRLTIDWAVDPSDEARIEVVPDRYTAALFDAVEKLGYALRRSELVEGTYLDDRPFAQRFDFAPTDPGVGDLDGIELTIMPREEDLRVFAGFSQRDAVAEEYDVRFDDHEVSITFDRDDASLMSRRLRSEIKQLTS